MKIDVNRYFNNLLLEASYYDEKVNLRNEVYDALGKIAFDWTMKGIDPEALKEAFDDALAWFNNKFWDDAVYEESLSRVKTYEDTDTAKWENSIGYQLKQGSKSDEIGKVLEDLNAQRISVPEAKKSLIAIIKSLPKVSEKEKSKALKVILSVDDYKPAKSAYQLLASSFGAYYSGINSITTQNINRKK